jgi:hypothetical protein
MTKRKNISPTDGRGRVLTGISPPRGSHRAAPVPCDASNAQGTAGQEYHCAVHASSPGDCQSPLRRCGCRSPSRGHGAQAARLGINRKCPFCFILRRRCLAGFLCQRANNKADKCLSACKNPPRVRAFTEWQREQPAGGGAERGSRPLRACAATRL